MSTVQTVSDDTYSATISIVSSYLSGGGAQHVTPDAIPALIGKVANGVQSAFYASEPVVTEPVELKPAVSIKKSVTPDHLVCLECGEKVKMLKRHVQAAHGLSTDEYKAKWGLPSDYPTTAANYSQARSELAIKLGLGRKAAA